MAYDDPVFLGLMAAQHRNMQLASKMGIIAFIPWIKDILPRSWLGVDLLEKSLENIEQYFKVNNSIRQ